MIFDPTITPSEMITGAIASIGFIGAYFTFKANATNAAKRIEETDKKATVLALELGSYKLYASEHFVRRDDIDRLEERICKLLNGATEVIGRRMETVEHQLRNIDTKILGIVNMRNKDRE